METHTHYLTPLNVPMLRLEGDIDDWPVVIYCPDFHRFAKPDWDALSAYWKAMGFPDYTTHFAEYCEKVRTSFLEKQRKPEPIDRPPPKRKPFADTSAGQLLLFSPQEQDSSNQS